MPQTAVRRALCCIGPVGSTSSEEAGGASGRGPAALVAAVGHDRAGALAIMQQSVVPEQVTETPVTGTALFVPSVCSAASAC